MGETGSRSARIEDAAGATLTADAAFLYRRSAQFRVRLDRQVIDYLPLQQRIMVPIGLRLLGRLCGPRAVPWPSEAVAAEFARRSSYVPEAVDA